MACHSRILLLFHLLSAALASFAQDIGAEQDRTRFRLPTQRSTDILAGGNAGHYVFLELGVAKRWDRVVGHHPSTQVVFLSAEGRIGPEMVFAPKIGAWAGGGAAGMCMGINALYYMNASGSSACLRPEIGIGFEEFKVVYGYNILAADIPQVNRHMLALAVLFPVKRKDTLKPDVY